MLNEKLKWWNREVFSFKDLHIDKLLKYINELERVAAEGGSPQAEERKVLSAEFWQEHRIRESLLAQKSRTKWKRRVIQTLVFSTLVLEATGEELNC